MPKRSPKPTPDLRAIAANSTIHLCPREGESETPCCGRIPFELPVTDRLTLDPKLVTCRVHDALAEKIARDLFGWHDGGQADRLVLKRGGILGGGWCFGAVRDRIARHLKGEL